MIDEAQRTATIIAANNNGRNINFNGLEMRVVVTDYDPKEPFKGTKHITLADAPANLHHDTIPDRLQREFTEFLGVYGLDGPDVYYPKMIFD